LNGESDRKVYQRVYNNVWDKAMRRTNLYNMNVFETIYANVQNFHTRGSSLEPLPASNRDH